jgi:ribosomal protein S18 acetylase RimI-like enzyme
VTDLTVRTAAAADIAAVEPLVTDALGRLRTLSGGAELLVTLGMPADVAPDALASALCGGVLLDVCTLVAVLEDDVAGLCVLSRAPGSMDLVGIHTARSLRRRRIGSTLLAEAQTLAAAAGVPLDALALPGDQTVKSLLESAGFKARLLRMSAGR